MQANNETNQVELNELERAYKIAARIVSNFGDAYLPTFQRLHEELQIRYRQQDLKSIALDIANNSKG